ncbi:SurA N-terminal domain-containing protein [Salinibacillus xinjiangensis]|uniref:Uncharacterized protein n=1 Tax=Salinibacillus xinjiangensis TaxID=1229268 RepID=A0A6G1X459_9BACI|nr:SurA N-terminal domain-containing protein [Salinibacillus xinjiangensis]MRG85618.1 hypothetical protein [Salinibacillus xinjiangensis]
MQKTKLLVLIVIVIIFFIGFQWSTKGYVFVPPDLIEKEEIDRAIAITTHQMEQLDEAEVNQDVKENIIDSLIQQKALVAEAKDRGIEVSEEMVNKKINSTIERMKEFSSDELGLTSFLKEKGLTIEEYFQNYIRGQMEERVLIDKLYQEMEKKLEAPRNYRELDQEVQSIVNEFREMHQEEITELKEQYL